MESERPLFQILVNQKGWQEYEVFKRRYQEAARELADLEGPSSLATAPPPEKRQFVRWVHGEVKTAPRTEARRILQFMFPGIPVGRLFAPASAIDSSPDPRSAREFGPEGQLDYGAEDVVMAAANESARFAAGAESSNVGPHTMEQLEAGG